MQRQLRAAQADPAPRPTPRSTAPRRRPVFSLADGSYQWPVYPASGTRQAARYRSLAAHGSLDAS
jgi:hypothetical protein